MEAGGFRGGAWHPVFEAVKHRFRIRTQDDLSNQTPITLDIIRAQLLEPRDKKCPSLREIETQYDQSQTEPGKTIHPFRPFLPPLSNPLNQPYEYYTSNNPHRSNHHVLYSYDLSQNQSY